MDVIITLFYILFSICVVYPPTEFVSAGFTIPQLFDNYLGSESKNFINYHMKRITITALIHSALPLGYTLTLWCGGERGEWMPFFIILAAFGPLVMIFKTARWWAYPTNHPIVKALLPYVGPGMDWRQYALNLDIEFSSIEKVSIPLNGTSKLITTLTWLIKVTQYRVHIVKQADCALVATATDSHNFTTSGEDEVQYLNIEAIPARADIKKFSFRMSTSALRDLQVGLERPIRVPDHISIQPSLTERFVYVFKHYVGQNPVFWVDEEMELCIGCMQNTADVKLTKQCPPHSPDVGDDWPECQQCNCRVLWCCSCMGRWWAERASGGPASWLSERGTCPMCRAVFCMLDVCPARRRDPTVVRDYRT